MHTRVWIWRSSNRYEDPEFAIFSSRSVIGEKSKTPFYPAVIFNIKGKDSERFFFASVKFADNSYYGFWSDVSGLYIYIYIYIYIYLFKIVHLSLSLFPFLVLFLSLVRYHEWQHIALVVADDVLFGYIDGRLAGSAFLGHTTVCSFFFFLFICLKLLSFIHLPYLFSIFFTFVYMYKYI